MENSAENFVQEVQTPEARAFYFFQIFIHNNHTETRSFLVDTYVLSPVKQSCLL